MLTPRAPLDRGDGEQRRGSEQEAAEAAHAGVPRDPYAELAKPLELREQPLLIPPTDARPQTSLMTERTLLTTESPNDQARRTAHP